MKKLIVSLLAVAGMVACSNEHVVRQQAGEVIGFSGAFVDNATRADQAEDPSIITAEIDGFDVWGFMDSAEGVVFMDEDVTGSQGNFTYANTQYWVPGHNYYFAALAPMNSNNVTETLASGDAAYYGLGTIKFNVTDGAEDLLYSAVGPIVTPAVITTVEPVKFQFHHMLSKVKFSFTNGFKNDNAFIDVKNIKMVVPETGTIDLAVADWWSTNQWVLGDTTKEIAFGDACYRTARNGKQESDVECIILPADATQKYTVTFDVVLYQGTVKAYEGTKTVTIENVPFEIGKAYNLKAVLDASNIMADGTELLPIVFDVQEVKDWDYGVENENEYDIFGPESGDDESDEPAEPETPAVPEFVIPGEGVTYDMDYEYTTLVAGLDANNSLRVKQENGWIWDIKFNTGLASIEAGDYKAGGSSFSSNDALEVDTYNGGFQNNTFNYIYPDEYDKVTTFNVQKEGDYYCITMIGSGGYGNDVGTFRCVYIGMIK